MSVLFADTFYFLALLNADDEAHDAADRFAADTNTRVLTTTWVLTELADGLSETDGRTIFADFLRELSLDAQVVIVPADQSLWERAVELYASRHDKQWSLTDCVSFIVMRDKGITYALTADHHFEQTGFAALLK